MILIALGYKRGVGKTTIARYICARYGGKIFSISNEIENTVYSLFDKDIKQHKHSEVALHDVGKSPRTLLQETGQAMVNIWNKVWMRKLEKRIDRYLVTKDLHSNSIVVIDDIRRAYEINFLRSMRPDSTIVKVERNTGIQDNHTTEHELDSFNNWDILIKNNGDIDSLHKVVHDKLIWRSNKEENQG